MAYKIQLIEWGVSSYVDAFEVAVVVAFFICWAPFHAQRLLAIYGEPTSSHMIKAFQILTYISGVLYYLSTTVNPLLYHIMSNKFREAFKTTYKQCCRKRGHIPGGRCYSTLSARSSHVNSHSNTDSYSQGCSSLRYLEGQMARLQDSRRPLVVSFRRKNAQSLCAPGSPRRQHVIVLDGELQEALETLKGDRRDDSCSENVPVISSKDSVGLSCSFVEVHSLQPTHICPLSSAKMEVLQVV